MATGEGVGCSASSEVGFSGEGVEAGSVIGAGVPKGGVTGGGVEAGTGGRRRRRRRDRGEDRGGSEGSGWHTNLACSVHFSLSA